MPVTAQSAVVDAANDALAIHAANTAIMLEQFKSQKIHGHRAKKCLVRSINFFTQCLYEIGRCYTSQL